MARAAEQARDEDAGRSAADCLYSCRGTDPGYVLADARALMRRRAAA